jgi:hypothetical protein
MSRKEIIAQVDAEISRLERARDFLARSLSNYLKPAKSTLKARPPRQKKSHAAKPPVPVESTAQVTAPADVPAPPPQSPPVQRVPPRRRVERRQPPRPASAEQVEKSPAALTGFVPFGPVAVSATEARKAQERSVHAPAPAPAHTELRSQIGGERSLSSLVQAFERSFRSNGMETP